MMVRWGWRLALLGSSVPAVAVALAWLKVRDLNTSTSSLQSPRHDAAGRALASRSFVLLTASYSLQGYVGYIFVFWFYLYLVQERHFTLLSGGLLAALPWALSLRSLGMWAVGTMALFLAILSLGWLYAFKEGILEWK